MALMDVEPNACLRVENFVVAHEVFAEHQKQLEGPANDVGEAA